jgi:acyl dehydratase
VKDVRVTDTAREFEEATKYKLQDRDIEMARALVGVETPNRTREQLTVATPDAIRNYARAVGDDNPLWHDGAYGLTTRWGSQIASPSMTTILNAPMKGDRAPEGRRGPSWRGIHVFVSGGSTDWYRPVFPGDTLYSYQGLESVEEKQSEFADRSVIQVHRTVKCNQRGEVVAILRLLAIYTERKTARDRGKYAEIEPAVYTDADIAEIDAVYAAEGPRGAEKRYWEDVRIGEELPKMAKGPLTETEIIVFHSGGYGFVPYAPSASRIGYKNRQRIPKFYVKNEYGVPDVAQRVHWDSSWARAIGNPMAYDYGVMRECWLTHYLTDWIGDDGWIVRQQDEIRKFNYIGDTQVITGEVVGKREEGGRGLVDIELRATNQRGTVTAPGHATVVLPSRAHGPVRLPAAPDAVEQKATEMFARHCELGGMAPWANLTESPTRR